MNTFTIMWGRVPNGKKLISSRWVLRKKFNSQMRLARKKARLVICGNEQQAGIDYFETYALVLRYTTLRILLAKAAAEDLEADYVDIDTAFLNPDLIEEVYMKVLEFLKEVYLELAKNLDAFLKLNKSLYRLKQAPRAWFLMVKKFFLELGLRSSVADPNLFVGLGVSLLLFVDDMLIVGKRPQVDAVKAKILKQWKGKDLKAVDTFVGFQIERNRKERTIKIHQTLYITKLLERLGMDKSNPVALPIPARTVLKSTDDDDLLQGDDITVYRQIVGSTIYLANNTRPDIAYTVGQLARFMSKPAKIHYLHSKLLLRYLNGTREVGITYSNRQRELPRSYNVWTDAT
jgi:Reverse transcriptase (RNA-dependent DNA polymerase)